MLMKHFRFFCLPTTLTGLSHGVNFDWVLCVRAAKPATLSMAIFLSKCCDNFQNNSLADCAKTNKQQSSNTAEMQNRSTCISCSPRHPNASTGTAWHTHQKNTHRCPSTTNDTRPHKNKHTQANSKWLVGELVGT